MVCAATPEPFHAVGLWYGDFSPTTDEEVKRILGSGQEERAEESP
jgi:predicted phosphoribosyltransferase